MAHIYIIILHSLASITNSERNIRINNYRNDSTYINRGHLTVVYHGGEEPSTRLGVTVVTDLLTLTSEVDRHSHI
jgi:hypothetical protein